MNVEVIEAFEQLEKEKGIKKEVLISALEAALVSAFKRNFGSAHNVRVDVDADGGKIQVFSRRAVVDHVQDSRVEISVQEAKAIDPNYNVGDVVETEVTPRDFGRIAAQTAKQVVVQKIREAERGVIFEEYSNREGDVITGVVQRREGRNVIIDLGRVEAVMTPSEQMHTETYAQGDRIKIYIVEVRKTPKGPQVIVSRTHPGLLKRLFELEVPEVFDGIVIIKQIAREAGVRSKVAVIARDENVDPVGACVGPKGLRIQKIVSELKGEKIDVIEWKEGPEDFVARALSPAKVLAVRIDEVTRLARVIVPDSQLSLAIGREGQNARLAAKLTGWKIDIKSESQALEFPTVDELEEATEEPDVGVEAGAGVETEAEAEAGPEEGPGIIEPELIPEQGLEPDTEAGTKPAEPEAVAATPTEAGPEPGYDGTAPSGETEIVAPTGAGAEGETKPKEKKKRKKKGVDGAKIGGDTDETPPRKRAKPKAKARLDDLDEEDYYE